MPGGNVKGVGLGLGALVALAAGFAVGFVWGQGTKSALGDATQTDVSGGVVTVRVNAYQALGQGLKSGLSALIGGN